MSHNSSQDLMEVRETCFLIQEQRQLDKLNAEHPSNSRILHKTYEMLLSSIPIRMLA